MKVKPPTGVLWFYVKNVDILRESFPDAEWNLAAGDFDHHVPGVPGQNTATPSKKHFDCHYIMRRGSRFYDPSYGQSFLESAGASPEEYYTATYLGLWDNNSGLFKPVTRPPLYSVDFEDKWW